MRVITGKARGRKLKTVDGLDVRPTTDKVKQAIFSSIAFEVEGSNVVDLFCGSGQMGIEALSRGANFCVFVDSSRKSHEVAKENLTNTGLIKNARIVMMDCMSFLKSTKECFDIAFMDPPYSKGHLQEVLPLIAEKMHESGVIFAEHERTDILPEAVGDFVIKKQYNYGRISVSAYRHI